jgi:hypothetical protein
MEKTTKGTTEPEKGEKEGESENEVSCNSPFLWYLKIPLSIVE